MKQLIRYMFLLAGINAYGQPGAPRYAQLGAITDSVASIQNILSSPYLVVITKSGKPSSENSVIYFETSFVKPSGDTLSFSLKSNGNGFSQRQKRRIRHLKKASRIIFKDIRGSCPGCRLYRLPSFILITE